MKIYADLHLHSCLSPCGDNDMTPYNLVNMAKLLGFDMIALTDHNSCRNCKSAAAVGKEIGLTVVPGMELCTAEEIHCVCLLPDLDAADAFSRQIHSTMPPVENQPEIFGEQRVMDTGDGILDTEPLLLTTASAVSVDDLVPLVRSFGGACFPAHLDRASYSILSVLGFLYPELQFTTAEFTHKAFLPQYLEKHPLLRDMRIVRNSDAHYLENMVEPTKPLELRENSAQGIIDYINGI
ncbi:MAG: PHP domain-containing protein [Candidatus Fimenecus sp.]